MTKRNYRQAKRQKEDARKTRQLLKQQRRSARAATADGDLPLESPAPGALTDPAALPK